jgi:hypothetical protein
MSYRSNDPMAPNQSEDSHVIDWSTVSLKRRMQELHVLEMSLDELMRDFLIASSDDIVQLSECISCTDNGISQSLGVLDASVSSNQHLRMSLESNSRQCLLIRRRERIIATQNVIDDLVDLINVMDTASSYKTIFRVFGKCGSWWGRASGYHGCIGNLCRSLTSRIEILQTSAFVKCFRYIMLGSVLPEFLPSLSSPDEFIEKVVAEELLAHKSEYSRQLSQGDIIERLERAQLVLGISSKHPLPRFVRSILILCSVPSLLNDTIQFAAVSDIITRHSLYLRSVRVCPNFASLVAEHHSLAHAVAGIACGYDPSNQPAMSELKLAYDRDRFGQAIRDSSRFIGDFEYTNPLIILDLITVLIHSVKSQRAAGWAQDTTIAYLHETQQGLQLTPRSVWTLVHEYVLFSFEPDHIVVHEWCKSKLDCIPVELMLDLVSDKGALIQAAGEFIKREMNSGIGSNSTL